MVGQSRWWLSLASGIYFAGGGDASYSVPLQSSHTIKADKANFAVFNQLMAFLGRERSSWRSVRRRWDRTVLQGVGVGAEGGGESASVCVWQQWAVTSHLSCFP